LLYIHHGISITDGVSALAAKGQTESFSGSREQDRDWQTILHRDIKPSNG
jgi:serine/threonine protein kinase